MSEIRKLPAVEDRVETGPVQFGEDWPGTFIRGDNAFGYALALRNFIDGKPSAFDQMYVDNLLGLLCSSNISSELRAKIEKGEK